MRSWLKPVGGPPVFEGRAPYKRGFAALFAERIAPRL
jgi:hypothetical protein